MQASHLNLLGHQKKKKKEAPNQLFLASSLLFLDVLIA